VWIYGLWDPLGTIGNLFDDAKHGAALRQEGVSSAPVPTRWPWWLNAVAAAYPNWTGRPVLARVGHACTADQSNNAETVAGLGGVYVVVSEAGGSRARFWRGRPTGSRPRWPQRRAPCPGEAAFPPRLRRSILSPGR
jgi:hypothetical protein